jgi:thiol:disulfide interchange protein
MNSLEISLLGPALPAIAAAFAGGFLASLSPCVYPMIPIVSAYVGSRSPGGNSTARSLQLSLSYVFGMAAVYALLGMVAALSGGLFGEISTSPWSQLIVGNILILLALNLLEVFRFPTWFSGRSRGPGRGGAIGALLVGAASGLVASPCVSPVLLALLTFVATKQSVFYGASLLFAFSLGMGMLLVVAGTCSGLLAALPKPGRWMVGVKKLLGLLLLALAQYYLVKAGESWL